MSAPAHISVEVRAPTMGLFAATMVGVGAMLGAGIFVLSGVALRVAGPSALLAFGLNGVAAVITAFSFAELAGAFPEAGGGYVYAKKVLPIGGGFAAGWVLWFAYCVACALYALGFAGFCAYGLGRFGWVVPAWFVPAVTVVVICVYAVLLSARGAGAGNLISLLKLVVFAGLIAVGLGVLVGEPAGTVRAGIEPFFAMGAGGTLAAMGYTFITLEGFEVITAVSDEVKEPARTIPRAMFLSIGLTLTVYMGLLFVMLTIGGSGDGETWRELGQYGQDAVAVAVRRFAGPVGDAVVTVAALLATFTALGAALLGASRGAFAMARDRALPRALSRLREGRSPVVAVWVSAGIVIAVAVGTGSVEVAGAAASLIFLISFALTNAAGLLVRVRVGQLSSFRSPFHPLLPIAGMTICLGLGAFQAWLVPLAAVVAGAWLGFGVLLYLLYFRREAQAVSARDEALDERLVRLRGRTPLVLVPIANPERADALMSLANVLSTPGVGRVLALSVARAAPDGDVHEAVLAFDRMQPAMRRAVRQCARHGLPFEGVVRLEPDVARAVGAMVRERRPETVLLGMSRLDDEAGTALLDELIAHTSTDIAVLQAPAGWQLDDNVSRVLVPVAGELSADRLRARVLGTLARGGKRAVTLLRVLRPGEDLARAREVLVRESEDLHVPRERCELREAEDAAAAIVERAREADLLVLGLGFSRGRRALIGPFVRAVARDAPCPLLALAGARPGT